MIPAGPLVMGVLNITPDSFSDGGRLNSVETVKRQARRMVHHGAAVLDLGAQSTRPGAREVGPDEELERLLPALRAVHPLKREHPGLLISIDTFHAAVAEVALAEGADWINDVRGGNVTGTGAGDTLRDPAMLPLIARAGCPYVLMHSRGTSGTMDSLARYTDVVADVCAELQQANEAALAAGVAPEQLLWDVGLGFAKTTEQNLELVRRLPELVERRHGGHLYPLLIGPSRKRFIGAVLDEPRPRARLWGTAAVCALAVNAGVSIVRVHDVGPIAQVTTMAAAVRHRNNEVDEN